MGGYFSAVYSARNAVRKRLHNLIGTQLAHTASRLVTLIMSRLHHVAHASHTATSAVRVISPFR